MKTSRILKIYSVVKRKLIKCLAYINIDLYMKKYTEYLKDVGVIFCGKEKKVKYIEPSAYFDGTDYSLIHIGDNVTISREVMILTHDYSINTALCSIGIKIDRHKGECFFKKSVKIGDNTFIGARASLLGGSTIGNNCIIGACTVIKGNIPDAKKHKELGDYQVER